MHWRKGLLEKWIRAIPDDLEIKHAMLYIYPDKAPKHDEFFAGFYHYFGTLLVKMYPMIMYLLSLAP